jgi:hypothetical protein
VREREKETSVKQTERCFPFDGATARAPVTENGSSAPTDPRSIRRRFLFPSAPVSTLDPGIVLYGFVSNTHERVDRAVSHQHPQLSCQRLKVKVIRRVDRLFNLAVSLPGCVVGGRTSFLSAQLNAWNQ